MTLTSSPVYSSATQSQGSTFTSLPAEIKQAMFCLLPDVACLKSLVLTCSTFYRSFLDAPPHKVLNEILRRQIGADLIPLAGVIAESADLRPWSKAGALDILSHLHKHWAPTPWTLPRALYVSQLHSHVEFFAAGFTATKLSNEPQPWPSRNEILRIRRSFYLFELYCNLFRTYKSGKKHHFSGTEQRDLFFNKFAPWENEQLACVHDYLYEQLSIAFNDVAEHDVEWGEWSIPYDEAAYNGTGNPYKQHYLSQGLQYLHKLVTTTDYDKRLDLLNPNLRLNACFLFKGLTTQYETHGPPLYVEDYTDADRERFISKPFFVDHDIGPVKAWNWVHAYTYRGFFYFCGDHYGLRQQGYVMWDYCGYLNGTAFRAVPMT